MIRKVHPSVRVDEHIIVMRRDSPVFTVVVFLRVIFLVVSEESIELNALFEVLNSFHTSNLLKEIEVSVNIDASSNKSVPVHTLNLDVSVELLELEVNSLVEIDVWSLDCVHVLSSHFELIKIKILGEDLHLQYLLLLINLILV